MAGATTDLYGYLSSLRRCPNYTAWWRAQCVWTTCPESLLRGAAPGSWKCDLLVVKSSFCIPSHISRITQTSFRSFPRRQALTFERGRHRGTGPKSGKARIIAGFWIIGGYVRPVSKTCRRTARNFSRRI